jgi:hypothetical protein
LVLFLHAILIDGPRNVGLRHTAAAEADHGPELRSELVPLEPPVARDIDLTAAFAKTPPAMFMLAGVTPTLLATKTARHRANVEHPANYFLIRPR